MKLTFLENFRRMIEHRDPAWLPLELPLTPPVAQRLAKSLGTSDLREAMKTDFAGISYGQPADVAAWLAAYAELGYAMPADAEIDMFGIAHVAPPMESVGEATHFRTMLHPLEAITDVSQLEKLPWPRILGEPIRDRMHQVAARHHAEGRVVHGSCECTLFESAWYLRGMDNLFMDLAEGNGIADWLMDYFTDRSAQVVRAYVEAGADVIGLGDDVGTQRGMMMSVDTWREVMKPRLKKVIDAARSAATKDRPVAIKYHSDGDIRLILDDLIEIGIEILNPVQPECMPVDDLVNAYKDRIGFWGMVGTQTVMPFGTPEEVRQVVADCARRAEEGAAVIVAPTHVLEPDVPDANIHALVEAVHEVRLGGATV